MPREFNYNENLDKIIAQIKKGAFLTVKSDDRINTMTIGWAGFGVMWNRPVITVLVRKSRHTYGLMENADNFTVSVPVDIDLRKALTYCGTYSGRDIDKIKEMKLTLGKSKSVETPIIKDCNYHYECKLIYSQPMDPNLLDKDILSKNYPIDDYHTFYIGEILESYITD